MFPYLTTLNLNDQAVLRIKTNYHAEIAVNIVYHNAKYFPSTHSRAHDEVRLYRNNTLDNALNLDRGVIVLANKNFDGSYGFISIQPNDSTYYQWLEVSKKFPKGDVDYELIKNIPETKKLLSFSSRDYLDSENSSEVIQKYTQGLVKSRQQIPDNIHEDDPAKPLESLFTSQDKFKSFIREMYGGLCAVRNSSLITDNFAGLQAAHIRPDNAMGPLLPTNGILMSSDIHYAFEDGFFTLTEDNEIQVSKKIPSSSYLWKYEKQVIQPLPNYDIYKPFHSYTQFHREEIFERKFA